MKAFLRVVPQYLPFYLRARPASVILRALAGLFWVQVLLVTATLWVANCPTQRVVAATFKAN
jgi:hypothetical protein